jgi:undecaprenyl-diphosphatase
MTQSSKNFTTKYFKKLSIGFIVMLLLFAGAVLLFALILHEVIREKEEAVDNYIFNFLSANVINNRLTYFMKGITYFASATFLQIAYGAVMLVYLLRKHWKRALEIAVIGIGGFSINYLMKLSFHRLRPPNPLIEGATNFSFPSGHATSGFIFYGLLAYLIWKTEIRKAYKFVAATLLIFFSVLIGASRVYLRVHYTSDVVAGLSVGFAWLLLSVWLFDRTKKKTDNEVKQKVA